MYDVKKKYTEELAVKMRKMNAALKVDNDKICLLLYADDAVVMSELDEDLQSLLDIVRRCGRDFCVRFSTEKSNVMIMSRQKMMLRPHGK